MFQDKNTNHAMRTFVLRVATFVMLATCFTNSQALIFSQVPELDAIAVRAPLAFRGVVQSVEHASAKMAKGSYPYTITTFRVLQGYRGVQAGEEIRIARMGGPVDGDIRRYLIIPGVPSFSAGDEVVLFHNDQQHPFFGASFGDHGVLRVAQVNGGTRQITSYNGQPLTLKNGAIGVDTSVTCNVADNNRSQCNAQDSSLDESASPSRAVATPVTVAAFDAHIALIVSAKSMAKPALTVSGDTKAFEAALRDAIEPTNKD